MERSDAEWRKLLTPDQYAVLRKEGTERAFTSPLLHEERKGTSPAPAATSTCSRPTTKFDSGTGWPSFWAPLEKAVNEERRPLLRHDADGGGLPPLRRPSRPCLQRRSQADGPALLHERRRVEVQAGLTTGRLHHDSVCSRLSRRRPDHRQPLHPAGPALRLRRRGPILPPARPAHAARHGGDFRAGRHARGLRRRLGGARQFLWPRLSRWRCWPCSAWRCSGRASPNACPRRWSPWAAPVATGRWRRAATGGVGAALLLGVATGLLWAPCAGPILGIILTGRRAAGRDHRHDPAAARLWPRRGDLAGAGLAGRRPGLRRDEALARAWRMGAARLRRLPCSRRSRPSRSAPTPASSPGCRWPAPAAGKRRC